MGTAGRSGASTARSALKILGLFSPQRTTVGVTEIAQALGLPKSNVVRLVSALMQEGFLTRDDRRRYRLGLRLHDLGQIVAHSHEFYQPSLEALSEVRVATGESTHLAVLNGREVVHLDRLRSLYLVKFIGPVYHSAVHATGTGKTLLAFAPKETQEAVLASPLERFTKHTITKPAALRRELARIRDRGVGSDFGEFVEELGCLTVPIRDRRGNASAVISVVAWKERLVEPRRSSIIGLLQRTSLKISDGLADPPRMR